ncbi:hypothetical protein DJ533_00360 (plasmid) [Acinetobacter defluvii]|uniref:Uncharacterized protein n=1 Tax=Acinetobacter defluvii TaxID=1871111 RepID=A0A2S2F8C4_9GAMM|nr:hypothetical protein [Acinetobacter defluvii]AWL27170.1 hypothetical protein DJ533_00360 [Acinetobacter defluvii]
MAGKNIAIAKPNKSSRFDNAATFASNTNAPHENVAAKGVESRTDTYREVFDAPESMKQDIKAFLATPNCQFKYKKDFIIQCIQDGLKKYGK